MPDTERLVMTRWLGRSPDGALVAVAVAPINQWERPNGETHEDWAAYVGVAPVAGVPDRRATDPTNASLDWIAANGRKLPKEAAVAIFGYKAETYRE